MPITITDFKKPQNTITMKTKLISLILVVSALIMFSCGTKEGYKGPSQVDIPEEVMKFYSSREKFLLKEPQITYGIGYTKATIIDYVAFNKAITEEIEANPGIVGLQHYNIYMDCNFIYFSGYANKATVKSKGRFTLESMYENNEGSVNSFRATDHCVQNEWLRVKATNNGYTSEFNQNRLDITIGDNDTGKSRNVGIILWDRNSGTKLYIYQDAK